MMLRDEISYTKVILDYSCPILDDILERCVDFDPANNQNIITEVKKSLYNWRNNPENNEKQLRKEFRPLETEWVVENRNIIGVAQQKDWLAGLNIGTIMHMNPLSYYESITTIDGILHLSKDHLLEKVQNLRCFARFARSSTPP
jgi:hypothetical protein